MIEVVFNSMTVTEYRKVSAWLSANCVDVYIDHWPFRKVVFESEQDAMCAILTFGGVRTKTKIEQMIENESKNWPFEKGSS